MTTLSTMWFAIFRKNRIKGGLTCYKVVGTFPLDHVAWTAGFALKLMLVSDALEKMPGINGKELWITGTVDPAARTALESKGWKVEDRVLDRLLKQ